MLEWAEGARRLAALELTARRRFVVEAVVEELEAEIVRRVGQTFDLARLASVYASSECVVPATSLQRVTTETWAYDLSVVQPAAFARVARERDRLPLSLAVVIGAGAPVRQRFTRRGRRGGRRSGRPRCARSARAGPAQCSANTGSSRTAPSSQKP